MTAKEFYEKEVSLDRKNKAKFSNQEMMDFAEAYGDSKLKKLTLLHATIEYIFRAIASPFFLVIIIIFELRQIITLMINYVRFGGESIVYTKRNETKSIAEVYFMIEDIKDEL